MTAKHQPRLPFDQLEQWIHRRWPQQHTNHTPNLVTTDLIADLVGANWRTIEHWRTKGVPLFSADQAATNLGTHPSLIWPDWYHIQ